MSIQEIRALNLKKIQELQSQDDSAAPATSAEDSKTTPTDKTTTQSTDNIATDVPKVQLKPELVPRKTLVRMNSDDLKGNAVFFVHAIDGSVNNLYDLAKTLKVPVYGLQRTVDLPLDTVSNLAEAYITVSRIKIRV